MGRGDRRTKRGKIFAGTYGVARPRLKKLLKEKKDAAIAAAKANTPEAK